MLGDLKILNMASALARHAAQRHQVIAENIANADSAGYRAKDLEPFAEAYGRQLSANGAGAFAGESDLSWQVVQSNATGASSPNGNTVSLEDQMIRSAEAQQSHEAATAIYKKTIEILRMSLGRGS